jgi:hypothetical protein
MRIAAHHPGVMLRVLNVSIARAAVCCGQFTSDSRGDRFRPEAAIHFLACRCSSGLTRRFLLGGRTARDPLSLDQDKPLQPCP